MTITTADQLYDAVAERWMPHLLPATIHTLHRAAIGYLDPNDWDIGALSGINRIADALDALLPSYCPVLADTSGKGLLSPAIMAKATASTMLQKLITAMAEHVPIGPWTPAHSSLAAMRGRDQSRYLSSFEQWAISAGAAPDDCLTAWGTNALDAQAVIAGTAPKPSFDDAFSRATGLLPDRAST